MINTNTFKDPSFKVSVNDVCETAYGMQMSDSEWVCFFLNYTNTTFNQSDSDGFIKCNMTDTCSYENNLNLTCGCGLNPTGQGYCPLAPALQKSSYKSYVEERVKQYDNQCHTVSRAGCYQIPDSLFSSIASLKRKSVTAHLYKDAVACADAVLNSAFIKLSLIGIAALIMILI